MLNSVKAANQGKMKLQTQPVTPPKGGVTTGNKGAAEEQEQSLSPMSGALIVAQQSHVASYPKMSDEEIANEIKKRSEKDDLKPTKSNLNFTESVDGCITDCSFTITLTYNDEAEQANSQFEDILCTHLSEIDISINAIRENLKQLYNFVKTLETYQIIQLTDPQSQYKFEPAEQLIGNKMDDGSLFSDFKKGKIDIDNIRKAIMGLRGFKQLFPDDLKTLEFDNEDYDELTKASLLTPDDFLPVEAGSATESRHLNVEKVKEKILDKLFNFLQDLNSELCGFKSDTKSSRILKQMMPEHTFDAFTGFTDAFKAKAHLPIKIMLDQLDLIYKEVGAHNKYYEFAAKKFKTLADKLLFNIKSELLPKIQARFDDTYKIRSKPTHEYNGLFSDSETQVLIESLESATTKVIETKDATYNKVVPIFKQLAETAFRAGKGATAETYLEGVRDGSERTLAVLQNGAPIAMGVVKMRVGDDRTVVSSVQKSSQSAGELTSTPTLPTTPKFIKDGHNHNLETIFD